MDNKIENTNLGWTNFKSQSILRLKSVLKGSIFRSNSGLSTKQSTYPMLFISQHSVDIYQTVSVYEIFNLSRLWAAVKESNLKEGLCVPEELTWTPKAWNKKGPMEGRQLTLANND